MGEAKKACMGAAPHLLSGDKWDQGTQDLIASQRPASEARGERTLPGGGPAYTKTHEQESITRARKMVLLVSYGSGRSSIEMYRVSADDCWWW